MESKPGKIRRYPRIPVNNTNNIALFASVRRHSRNSWFAFALISVILGLMPLWNSFADGAIPDGMTLLNNHFSAGTYAAGNIPRADLEKILHAGVRAPSAGNRQPWRFIVSADLDFMRAINLPRPERGNVVVIIAVGTGTAKKPSEIALFDAGCAAQAIYLAAQALGYGSRIYIGPVTLINKTKPETGLDPDETAVALVRIGRLPAGVDGLSAASSRKPDADIILYR